MVTGIMCIDQMEKINIEDIICLYAGGNAVLERRSGATKNEHMDERSP